MENMKAYWMLGRRKVAALLCLFTLGFSAPILAQAEPAEPVPEPSSPVESFSLPPGNSTTAPEPAPAGPVDDAAQPSANTPIPVQPAAEESDALVDPVVATPTITETEAQDTRPQSRTVRNPDPAPLPRQVVSPPRQRPEVVTPQADPIVESSEQIEPVPEITAVPAQPLEQANRAPLDQPTSDIDPSADPSTLYIVIPIALLLLAGIGIYVWRRNGKAGPFDNRDTATISLSEPELGDKSEKLIDEPSSSPAPEPAEPTINAQPNVESPSDGFVTTKIRRPEPDPKPTPTAANVKTPLSDQLSIEFQAESASSTLLNAVVGYRIIIKNRSEQPLKDLHISGTMIQADKNLVETAGSSQGQLLHEVDELESGQNEQVLGDIRLSLKAFNPIEFQSQKLFVPLVLLRFDYTDSDGNARMQAVNYLIGTEHVPPREKMAPFRLDLGPRNYADVAYRPFQS